MIVAIIQARMGSTRLPGKVLKDIGGRTMLARVVRRVRRAIVLHRVVVATTPDPACDAIVGECQRLGVGWSTGSEQDVLDRYYWTARTNRADVVVRITADCPLIDPEVITKVVRAFLEKEPDLASNTITRTYPRGLDVSVMTMAALTKTWREFHLPYQRNPHPYGSYQKEHVTAYIYQNPDKFRLLAVVGEVDYSNHHWTVDTQEDLDFVREIYTHFGNSDTFSWRDVLEVR